ncbi:MAG: patatin-like phospholipase family protein [Nitrospirae bacterium]|nr:patatin-like phospholipase family protein [Nitrospirota bacterium]
MKDKLTALVLQGGGALGAYEYGVIKALFEQKDFELDVVTGVSIGAISAAVVAGGIDDPVTSLGKLWDKLTAIDLPFIPDEIQKFIPQLSNPGMYNPNMALYFFPFFATSYSDMFPLYSTLDSLIDINKLNSGTPLVGITAINIETGELKEFDNYNKKITFDEIIASGSLPPSFPFTKVDNKYYWDGGLFSNTPLSQAINLLEKIEDVANDVQRELIVIELFPQKGHVPRNMNDVSNRMTQMRFENKLSHDKKLFKFYNSSIDMVHKMDKELPKESKIRTNPAFTELMGHKKIHKITTITPAKPELLSMATDFTKKSLTQSIEQGYKDGVKAIK